MKKGMKKRREKRHEKKAREKARKKGARPEEKARGAKIRLPQIIIDAVQLKIV